MLLNSSSHVDIKVSMINLFWSRELYIIYWTLPCGNGIAQSITLMLYHNNNLVLKKSMGGDERNVTAINIVPGVLYTATVVASYDTGTIGTGSSSLQT